MFLTDIFHIFYSGKDSYQHLWNVYRLSRNKQTSELHSYGIFHCLLQSAIMIRQKQFTIKEKPQAFSFIINYVDKFRLCVYMYIKYTM